MKFLFYSSPRHRHSCCQQSRSRYKDRTFPLEISFRRKRVNCVQHLISFNKQVANTFTETQPGRHHYILINSLNMAWASNATIRGFVNDRYGPPVEAEKDSLYSIFKEKFPEDQNTLKPGQKISDQKMLEEVGMYRLIQLPILNDCVIRALTLESSRFRIGLSLKIGRDITSFVHINCAVFRRQFKSTTPKTWLI